ncbi:uncharacterized protein BX664DRAFT_334640 [Halteromyces radiatus]|uniref:uncharacterized protein n=1 Tax=Halteromyces radiatus TaxID=101107 RepID=UPI00221FF76B|nr:uncharacterized protein BX664DRAFT_334640 [Halteromyces radiatus]KAI8085989.1 hypothetical protein BX664DRAFT_334640 [Halteromyces radiatus]
MSTDIHGQVVNIVFGVIDFRVDCFGVASLPVLDTMFALFIHYLYKSALGTNHVQISWLQGFFTTIVMASGGGCTVALLRGQPLGILSSNEFWIIHGLTYFLIFSNDYFYLLMQTLFSLPLVEHAFTVSDGFLRTMAMVQFGVDGVTGVLGHKKWMAQLICGMLAGCGGGLWMDAFRLSEPHWTFGTPQLLKSISTDMKITFATVVFYMCLVDDDGLLYQTFGITTHLDRIEAQAWSAIILTLGLIINTKITFWQSSFYRAQIEDTKKTN